MGHINKILLSQAFPIRSGKGYFYVQLLLLALQISENKCFVHVIVMYL